MSTPRLAVFCFVTALGGVSVSAIAAGPGAGTAAGPATDSRSGQDTVPQSQEWARSTEAREEKGGSLPSLAEMDTDRDGQVSQMEATPYERIENNFAEIDTNRDGSLDSAELSAFEAQWGGSKSAPMEEIEGLTEEGPAGEGGTSE